MKINGVNNIQIANKQSGVVFRGENKNATNPQIEKLPSVHPDYAVKTPISYTKTGEINLPYDIKAHCYKLANGQKVVIIPQDGETVLKTYVNTGSMNEPDNLRGISHYIEHNLFNGSEGLEEGDFFKQVDKMGADTNASTSYSKTDYFISSNLLDDKDLEQQIKLHSSMIERPLFALEKLEKEKGIVNSEINMYASNPGTIVFNKMLKNLYGIESASTDLIAGTTSNITSLKREDVVNYFDWNYYPANMVTVITGDVEPEETMKLISKYFTSMKQPSASRHFETFKPIQKTIREDLISDKATATLVTVGFNGPSSDNPKEQIYAEALSKLLSSPSTSRINKKVKRLNTECGAHLEKVSSNPQDGCVFTFMSECTDENSEKVLKAIFNELGNIANIPPSDEEMQIIKKKMLQEFSDTFESSFMTNSAIGNALLDNNLEYVTEYKNIVNSMTAQDLVDTAKKYLDVNRASVALVHPKTATEESIKQNHSQAVSFTGAKKEAIDMSKVQQYDLPNNFRVSTVNTKTDTINVIFEIKSDEKFTGKPSAVPVLDILLNEGSIFKNKEDMQVELAKSGIGLSTGATRNKLTSVIVCDNSNFDEALKTMKEVIENPRFEQKDFEYVKSLIKDKIKTSEKSAFSKLKQEIYKGLPKGISKEEILKDLETLTLDDVKDLYNSIINSGIGVSNVSGPFDRQPELKQTFFNRIGEFKPVSKFSVLPLKNVYKPVEETKVLTYTDFKNQAEIIEAFTYKRSLNVKDSVTLSLLNLILGGSASSRLFMDLREQQKLAYHVRSSFKNYDDIGMIMLKIGTTTDNKETGEQSFDNVKKSIDGFNKHIQKITTEEVTDEELQNAKLSMKNSILNGNHDSSGKIINLKDGINSPYGITLENEIFAEIDKITKEDILNAARYIFSGKPTYSIVATEDTLKANEEYFNYLKK